MSEKTIVITGGNSGLGFQTALNLAANLDTHLVLACRNLEKAENACREIIQTSGNQNIRAAQLDLSSLESVNRFSQEMKQLSTPIDVLLCNAGISSQTGRTKDGMDVVFESNYLGHFLLTLNLLPMLSKPGRIMMISSDMHFPLFGTLPWIGVEKLAYPDEALAADPIRYSYSKLLMLYFVYKLDRELRAAGSDKTINAFNPGLMPTTGLLPHEMFTEEYLEMIRHMDQLGVAEENGVTMAKLLTAEELGNDSGLYYARDRGPKASSELSYNVNYQEDVWNYSLKLCGISADCLTIL